MKKHKPKAPSPSRSPASKMQTRSRKSPTPKLISPKLASPMRVNSADQKDSSEQPMSKNDDLPNYVSGEHE